MSAQTKFENQCFAFVGIAQACSLVHRTANGQDPDPVAYSALTRALLEQNPQQVADLRRLGDFSFGKLAANGMLGRPDDEQLQGFRYVLAVIDASNRLRRFPLVIEHLAAGITGLTKPKDATSPDATVETDSREDTSTDAEVAVTPFHELPFDTPIPTWDMPWEQMAQLYIDTLGTLDSRIQVTGNANILRRPDIASKIRALLLMGVRFAWLWRQLGGRRWHLLTHRNRIRSTIDSLEF